MHPCTIIFRPSESVIKGLNDKASDLCLNSIKEIHKFWRMESRKETGSALYGYFKEHQSDVITL